MLMTRYTYLMVVKFQDQEKKIFLIIYVYIIRRKLGRNNSNYIQKRLNSQEKSDQSKVHIFKGLQET